MDDQFGNRILEPDLALLGHGRQDRPLTACPSLNPRTDLKIKGGPPRRPHRSHNLVVYGLLSHGVKQRDHEHRTLRLFATVGRVRSPSSFPCRLSRKLCVKRLCSRPPEAPFCEVRESTAMLSAQCRSPRFVHSTRRGTRVGDDYVGVAEGRCSDVRMEIVCASPPPQQAINSHIADGHFLCAPRQTRVRLEGLGL